MGSDSGLYTMVEWDILNPCTTRQPIDCWTQARQRIPRDEDDHV